MKRKTIARFCKGSLAFLLLTLSVAVVGSVILNSLIPTDGELLFGDDLRLLLRLEDGNVVLRQDGSEIASRPTFSKGEEVIVLASLNSDTTYEITEIQSLSSIPNGFFGRAFSFVSGFFADHDAYEDALIHVTIKEGDHSYKQYADLRLRRPGTELAVAHFDGDLTISPQTIYWDLPDDLALMAGNKPTDLRVEIGTKSKAKSCWTMVEYCELPPRDSPRKREWVLTGEHDCFPTATVVYPPKLRGGEPVTQTYILDQFC